VGPTGLIPHFLLDNRLRITGAVTCLYKLYRGFTFSDLYHFNTILPSMSRSSKWSFLQVFPSNPGMCCFPMHATCPNHLIPTVCYPNNIWHAVQIMKPLIMQFSPFFCQFLPLGPNIFLSTLPFNTLSLCSSCDVKDQVSHPYKITGKISVLYI
jgi:hypothetical protein